jgi:hypothetical protein
VRLLGRVLRVLDVDDLLALALAVDADELAVSLLDGEGVAAVGALREVDVLALAGAADDCDVVVVVLHRLPGLALGRSGAIDGALSGVRRLGRLLLERGGERRIGRRLGGGRL